ncbi:MAG: hypothetical protein WBB31_17045 [Saprospiraceae bacterium]
MQQLRLILPVINGLLKTYKIPRLICVFILATYSHIPVHSQTVDPVTSIRDLREGYLIVRMPASKPKIDTLQSMIARTSDNTSKLRLQRFLDEAREERDSLLADYTRAFRDYYHFSRTAYFFDYDGRDLRKASFYKMDGTPFSKDSIGNKPVFYLYFERTEESHIEALVIYNVEGLKVPTPFPNNFTRGGINFLFLKMSERKFPAWRVDRINKRLFKYWRENRGELGEG